MSLICALFVKYIFIYIYRLEERHSLRSLLLYLSSTLGGGEGRKGETSEWRERERERWGMGSRQGMTRGRERERDKTFFLRSWTLLSPHSNPCVKRTEDTPVYIEGTQYTRSKIERNSPKTYFQHTILLLLLFYC